MPRQRQAIAPKKTAYPLGARQQERKAYRMNRKGYLRDAIAPKKKPPILWGRSIQIIDCLF